MPPIMLEERLIVNARIGIENIETSAGTPTAGARNLSGSSETIATRLTRSASSWRQISTGDRCPSTGWPPVMATASL